jgi:hypothetical protein
MYRPQREQQQSLASLDASRWATEVEAVTMQGWDVNSGRPGGTASVHLRMKSGASYHATIDAMDCAQHGLN